MVAAWLVLPAVLPSPASAATQDTVVVEAAGSPAWGSAPRLVEEVRLGALQGADEEMFGSVGSIAVTPGGNVVIADIQVPVLRLYSPEGVYLGDAGRKGEGPGEYQTLLGVRPHPGGFAVWDPANARVSVFDEAGAFLRSFRVASGLHTGDAFQVDTTGTFYVKGNAEAGPADASGGGSSGVSWLVLDAEGEIRGAIPVPAESPEGPAFALSAREGQLRPFTVRTEATISPHGYRVAARNDVYALLRPMRDGRMLRIERPYRAIPVAGEERKQWERWVEFFSRMSGRRFGEVPEWKPAFHDFFVDDDGRYWVRRYVAAAEGPDRMHPSPDRPPFTWREPTTYDVIEADGRFLGTLVLPPDTRPRVSRGLQLWATAAGELDETYVVRFRIEPGP